MPSLKGFGEIEISLLCILPIYLGLDANSPVPPFPGGSWPDFDSGTEPSRFPPGQESTWRSRSEVSGIAGGARHVRKVYRYRAIGREEGGCFMRVALAAARARVGLSTLAEKRKGRCPFFSLCLVNYKHFRKRPQTFS